MKKKKFQIILTDIVITMIKILHQVKKKKSIKLIKFNSKWNNNHKTKQYIQVLNNSKR